MDITNRKITVELDELDAGLLLGLLVEMTGRIPSGLRPLSPWTRVREQIADSLAREEAHYGRFRGAIAANLSKSFL